LLVGFACRLLRGPSAHWRYLLWIVVLIKCVVPPVVSITLPGMPDSAHQILSPSIPATQSAQNVDHSGDAVAWKPNPTDTASSQAAQLSRPPVWERIDWPRRLLIAWAASALSYLMVALFRGWRIQQGLIHGRIWPDMELECEFLELTKTVGTRFRPKLCLIRGLSRPFVWAFFGGIKSMATNS